MARDTLRYAHDRAPSAKPLLFLTLLAVVLLIAVPISVLVALFMVVFGHVVGGLALIGASLLAAVAGVVLAGASGVRHLQRIVAQKSFRVVQIGQQDYQYAESCDCGHDHSNDGIEHR